MRNGKLWSNEHCNHSRRHSTRSTLGIATLSVQFALLLSRVWLGDAVGTHSNQQVLIGRTQNVERLEVAVDQLPAGSTAGH
jgi:hypothetical protein